MNRSSRSLFQYPDRSGSSGFTLIELMIVIAIIAILLALALPVYSNYSIRAKIAEGLSVAASTKTAVSSTCVEDPSILVLNNSLAGFTFVEATGLDDYIQDIVVTGACTAPLITITTKNTGQTPAPIILMTGEITPGSGQVKWACSSTNTPNWLLPNSCRS